MATGTSPMEIDCYIVVPVLSDGRGPQRVFVYYIYRQWWYIWCIYRCDIETIAVNNNSGKISMFVGLYTNGGE